ncbi:MAG TPA: aminotransferase class I/II-fold pyridoxal phosphate-dependent enzyme, partial [Candidatus Marinimicrobia bacterium]|nr:aminotransferase class I/II-fold pyridoxal phosphate-dependent enzyme [Candidatus Neomarinimicrobiota bacterium]
MSLTQKNIPVLKPLRVARISEISESTASASVPDARRVSFHIGNPVQDIRLEAGILKLLAGDENPAEHPLWSTIVKAASSSVPYAPRGGYRSHNIPELTRLIHEHLLETEREGLEYNLGENGEPRELVFCSGGLFETLRVLLRVLNTSLEINGARIIPVNYDLSLISKDFNRLRFLTDPGKTENLFIHEKTPVFFILGRVLTEAERKNYRQIALDNPVMFIELNDAPNHLSMAREAGLRDHVIRFLSASVFRPELSFLPVVTVLGNAGYLQQLETIHFELKGTPSVSELCAMEAFLSGKVDPAYSGSDPCDEVKRRIIPAKGNAILKSATDIFSRVSGLSDKILNNSYLHLKQTASDPLASFSREELLDLYGSFTCHSEGIQELETSFLAAFLKSYPFYKQKECCVVSGSARTALGILGYHSGISDVIISDMSWNYEHAFPVCRPVPPLSDLRPDVDAILRKVDQCIYEDPLWKEKGAVVLNTPHNATGLVWKQKDLERLVRELANRHVRIIDDLSYYGIAPINYYKPE